MSGNELFNFMVFTKSDNGEAKQWNVLIMYKTQDNPQ